MRLERVAWIAALFQHLAVSIHDRDVVAAEDPLVRLVAVEACDGGVGFGFGIDGYGGLTPAGKALDVEKEAVEVPGAGDFPDLGPA